MARRVDEGDLLAAGPGYLICADMLGDAARFMSGHIGLAHGIEQRRLAVVDMAHDGDDGRPRFEGRWVVDVAAQAQLDVRIADPAQAMTEFVDDQFGGIGIQALVDRRHDPHLHQRLDDVRAALSHAAGQLLHGDALGNDDIADDAGRILLLLLDCLYT